MPARCCLPPAGLAPTLAGPALPPGLVLPLRHHSPRLPLACVALCCVVLAYNLLGGFLFLALEGNRTPTSAVAASQPALSSPGAVLRARAVERLWAITEDLNILYKENWTKLAARELLDFQRGLLAGLRRGGGAAGWGAKTEKEDDEYQWTFSTSFLYALTLITTIGCGDVAPASSWGRVAAVLYAGLGIPLVTLYLSTLGAALARAMRRLYARLAPTSARARHAPNACRAQHVSKDIDTKRTPFEAALNLDSLSSHWTCGAHTRVPAALSVLLLALYVALGAAVFARTERWSALDGCYFSFSSLATIGFGALRPGGSKTGAAHDAALGICCLYILVGVVVVAGGFDLLRDDLGAALRAFTEPCGGRGRTAPRGS